MDFELPPPQAKLVQAGNAAAVKVDRDELRAALADAFTAIVERATGRKVVGFASHTVIEARPPWAIEVFRLAAPEES